MDSDEYVLSALIVGFILMMSQVSYAIVGSIIDESRHGIFFQCVSDKVIVLRKSKLERVHRLMWGIISFSALIYHLVAAIHFFQIEINNFLFYPIVIVFFLWSILLCVKVYLRDLDKIFILDSENQIVKINNKPINLLMISCILVKPSLVLMKTSTFSHEIFLKMKDGKKIYLGYSRYKNLRGIVIGLYDFLNVDIVDKAPRIWHLDFKNFSRKARESIDN